MNESTWSNKAVGFDRFLCAIFIQPQMRAGCQMRKKSRVLTRHQSKVKHDRLGESGLRFRNPDFGFATERKI